MVFYILLAFHINLINSKCCTQHTYANFFISLLIINCWFYLFYNDVFTTKHKHPLFMTPSSYTTFHLLAHVSLLQCRYHQTCWPLGGFSHIFLQDIHVLALRGPNGSKIIIDPIIAKNWIGFWHGQVLIIQITLGHFLSSLEILYLMMSWQV